MDRYKWLSVITLIGCLAVSCGKDLPELEGLNKQEWNNDKNGCLNKRSGMAEAIRSQTEKLLALNEMQIVNLLGKPDENELYKRNQKFYYYYLKPARVCGEQMQDLKDSRLVIRFNAMGFAKEVAIE
jgi:hypothetical protein